jgi:hypothetical protein
MYSKFNPMEDYITLLDSLEHLIMELREKSSQKRQCKKKSKQKETRFNHSPANVPQFPNVTTRSRGPVSSTDLSSLMPHSNLTPGPIHPDVTEPPPVSQGTTITDRSNGADDQSEITLVDQENPMLKAAGTANTGMPARDKLKQEIEYCKKTYQGKTFIVNGDESSETVLPEEISGFFSRFQEGTWLADSNLMPLLFSFRWPSTTLVLHSSYMSFTALENGSQQSRTRVRWPLRRDHNRIVLPCCNGVHWTLYDVDLERNSIRHYDSLAGSPSDLVVSAIKERLAYAMEGREIPKRDFTMVSGVSEHSHPCICPINR